MTFKTIRPPKTNACAGCPGRWRSKKTMEWTNVGYRCFTCRERMKMLEILHENKA